MQTYEVAPMLTTTKEFLQQVFRDFSQDECPSMAAALAYATLFALPSLWLIVIFIAGLVLGPRAANGEIEKSLSGAMGPQAAAKSRRWSAAWLRTAPRHRGDNPWVGWPDGFGNRSADAASA